MAQDGPKIAQVGPRWPQVGPRWPQDGPKLAQDGPQMAPRRRPNRSQIGLARPSDTNAEQVSVLVNVERPFREMLGPSWGPYGAYVGPYEGS